MVNKEELNNHLSQIGVTLLEIDNLNYEESIQYLRFHHLKYWGISTILFLGFSQVDEKKLFEKAIKSNLKVKNRLGNDLNFICISELLPPKKFEKAKSYPAVILTRDIFDLIFNDSEYSLHNDTLYDFSIAKDFRIAKPLSNFNHDIEIESFSFDNENSYVVNLYKTTCTCKDFEKKQRSEYPKGDIRRLCKHLMDLYKNSFGTSGLSDLNKFIIDEGYPVKKNIYSFNLQKSSFTVLVNYDSKDDWWNIFMQVEKGSYRRYGYSPVEKRFANNEKPIGLVPELRIKLDGLSKQLSGYNISNGVTKVHINAPKGSLVTIVFIIIFILFMVYILS